MKIFDTLVRSLGKTFVVIRDNEEIATVKGIYQSDKYIKLPFNTDVKPDDKIYFKSMDETFTVASVKKIPVIRGEGIDHLEVIFKTQNLSHPSTMNINIQGNAIGSAFGQNATNNYTVNKSIEQTITENGYNPEDFKDLLITLREAINNDDCKKGFLSKFSSLLSKHSWLSAPIAQELIKHFTE